VFVRAAYRGVWQEMRRQGQDPNSRTFNAMIRAYGDNGLLDRALSVFESMEGEGGSLF